MKLPLFFKDVERRTGIGVYTQIINLVLMVIVGAQAIALAKADRTHRETLIPPGVTKTFWVEDERVSPEYLEQMGAFLLQLALNRHPANAEHQIETLLRYVSPDSYGTLKKQLMAQLQTQLAENISTIFQPRTTTVANDRMWVMFQGVLITYIADKPVRTEDKRYMIKFSYHGGKTYILEMLDVTTEKDPFHG